MGRLFILRWFAVQVTAEGSDIAFFAIGPGMKGHGLVDFRDTSFTAFIGQAIPEWTPLGHSDGPLRHGRLWIGSGDGLKLLESFLIPEGMQ